MKDNRRRDLLKTLLPFGALALTAALVITVTLALFSDKPAAAQNKLKLGDVNVEVSEPGVTYEPDTTDGGTYYTKNPSVVNTGNVAVYARVMVVGGTANFDFIRDVNGSESVYSTLAAAIDTSVWITGTDGYIYYNAILAPGDSTPALFDKLKLKTPLPTGTTEDNFDIAVYTEVIQAEGLLDTTGAVTTPTSAVNAFELFAAHPTPAPSPTPAP
ncbi:MAG: hypothetical protein LBS90_09025 [Oscillospiraceae bacterium]|jgi:predicted ribosomally synthesized peptide with SipW-like signal peptide|nr:hypothetical protein [Oscillospiraceae bacterium]